MKATIKNASLVSEKRTRLLSFEKYFIKIILAMSTWVIISCNSTGGLDSIQNSMSLYSPGSGNLKVLLTDAPKNDVAQVNVDIDHIELWLDKDEKPVRLIIGQNMGRIDLLKLREGVLMSIQELMIPIGVTVRKIRMVLKPEGHFLVKNNENTCYMKTPSAQQTGIKIILKNPVTIEPGHSYSMVIDFDANKSIVLQPKGGCLLKPVLKLKSFTRVPKETVDEEGNTDAPEEFLTDGSDANVTDDQITDEQDPEFNWDDISYDDPATWPPGMTADELVSYFF